ncbi:hypothetical protein R84B8_00993 [Treponema sp. R8-4-B8]
MSWFQWLHSIYEYIRPVLDIVLLAFILYKGYELLEKTQALPLVKGTGFLFLVYGIAWFLNLTTLRWALTIIAPGLFIAIAIVFQPELRKIVLRLGQTEFFKPNAIANIGKLDAVVTAAELLSEKRRGMLVVFPRKINLKNIIDTGTKIIAEDIEAYIDLARYSNEGNYRVPVQIRKKGGALGVEPLEISVLPIEIPILLEQKVTRNVSVFPVLSGTVAEGYELANQSLIPSSVIVEGPRSILDGHVEFNTETINLDGRYNDFTVMVNIKNDNPMLSIYGSNLLEFRGTISRIARERRAESPVENASGALTNDALTSGALTGGEE